MNGQNGFRRGQMSLGSSNVESHPFQNRKRETKAVSELRKECRTWFNNHVRPVCIGNREERSVIVEVYESGTLLTVRKRFFDETLAKNLNNCRLSETMKVATHFEEWIPRANFIRREEGIHHPCSFLVYHTSYYGVSIEFKAKDDGCVYMMHFL